MDYSEKEHTLVLAKPVKKPVRTGGEACLILLHPPGSDLGNKTLLTNSRYLVGRGSEVDLNLSRDSVSRRHAELKRDDSGEWSVSDLGSTNGTFVNEAPAEHQPLRDGDQVRFGDAIFKFLRGANIESAYHEEIYRMTIVDGLTGIHNKRYLDDFLERELASAHRHEKPLSLVMLDIDHFKQVNDQRGHLCGDAVLKQISKRIQDRMRREDLFARYGGEEFAAVLGITTLDGAIHFAEDIRMRVASRPFTFNGEEFPVTVSLGVACVYRDPDVTVTELIKKADANLYKAKRGGRNCVYPPLGDGRV